MAFTAIFEIIEFSSAMAFGDASNAFLGSQGDIWDAQWDMIMCGIGSLASILLVGKIHLKMIKSQQEKDET